MEAHHAAMIDKPAQAVGIAKGGRREGTLDVEGVRC